jgi:hypothetical protein
MKNEILKHINSLYTRISIGRKHLCGLQVERKLVGSQTLWLVEEVEMAGRSCSL